MRQEVMSILIKLTEKIIKGLIILIGEMIKVFFFILAFGVYFEERLEMWICIIIGYILQIKIYKEFLFVSEKYLC